MFAQNIVLLSGLLVCSCIGFFLLLASVIGLKISWWHARWVAQERADRAVRLDEHGEPLPPASRGVCTACGVVFPLVYNLSLERRLCPLCYRDAVASGTWTPRIVPHDELRATATGPGSEDIDGPRRAAQISAAMLIEPVTDDRKAPLDRG